MPITVLAAGAQCYGDRKLTKGNLNAKAVCVSVGLALSQNRLVPICQTTTNEDQPRLSELMGSMTLWRA